VFGFYQGSSHGPNPATALNNPLKASDSQDEQFKVFWEAWNLVKKEYYKPEAVDTTKMTYGAIQGMLSALGDNHTGFASPEISKIQQQDLQGNFSGIGVSVESRDGLITVVSPMEGSPGEAAGVKAGDVIIKVDGKDVTTLSLMEAVSMIRGPKGTQVELTLARKGESSPVVLKITRADIKVDSVTGKILDNDGSKIAYVKVSSFTDNTTDLLNKKLKELMAQNPQGMILDLRNNPGGLLEAGVEVASQFMSEGVVLHQETGTKTKDYNVKSGGLATKIPLTVLINGGSASASEIVAGALQDTERAKLIGEPSYGKDTVQYVHTLSDKSTVRITISQWLTPNRQDIHEKGLKPDLLVPMTETDYDLNQDPQLDQAVQYLQQLKPAS
jgi:carboxyl-terminal processing protease